MMENESSLSGGENNRQWHRMEMLVPVVLLLMFPLILPFARRAGPLTLSLAAIFAFLCLWQRSEIKSRLQAIGPRGLSLLAFFAWSTITLFWSPWVERGLTSLLTTIEIFLAAALVLALPAKLSRSRLILLATVGLAVASLCIFVDLRLGAPLLKLLNSRPDSFRYNMVLVSLLPLSLVIIPTTLKADWIYLRIVALVLYAFALFSSESETAKVAFLIMYACFFVALYIPKPLALGGMIILVTFAWLSAPWLAQTLVLGKPFLGSFWETGHAAERIAIWQGFGEMALAGLPWGWGIDASPVAQLTSFFAQASAETQKNVSWLHPHSMPLQIYVELGLPGVLLCGLASLLALPRPSHSPKPMWAKQCAFVSVVFTVSMISHGVWQTWWWVGVAIGIYGFKFIAAREQE